MHKKSVKYNALNCQRWLKLEEKQTKNLKVSYLQYPASQTPHDIQRPWKEVTWMVQKTVDCPFLPIVTFPLVPSGLYKSTPKHLSLAKVDILLSLLLWHRKYKWKKWWSDTATDHIVPMPVHYVSNNCTERNTYRL
jgi:hypothetical protein